MPCAMAINEDLVRLLCTFLQMCLLLAPLRPGIAFNGCSSQASW